MNKFEPQFIKVKKKPVIIVGQNPGNQRRGQQNEKAFHGNKTGDLVESAVRGLSNVILTNACNWQKPTAIDWIEGQNDLFELIDKYKPRRVICLGNVATESVRYILDGSDYEAEVVTLPHPSWVIRFNKGSLDFREKLRQLCL